MQTKNTFSSTGWDFDYVWEICEGTDYPVLLSLIPPCDFACPDGIDFVDMSFLASHWLDVDCDASNHYCQSTDLDKSGAVGVSDLGIFADSWLEGVE